MVKDKLLELPFDQYQRHRAATEILEIIKEETGKKLNILDVGGYFKNSQGEDTSPLKEFLPQEEIVVLDKVPCRLSNYIRGDATVMPFHPESFDVVNCQDVLEHIPPGEREKFLDNLLRTSRYFIILGAPFRAENSELAEKILYEFIQKTLKGRHRELEEHIENGLPEFERVEAFLAGKKVSFCHFPSGYLSNWLLLMMIKHFILSLPDSESLASMIDRFYNKNFYESDQRPPSYRMMLVISKLKKNELILKKIAERFKGYQEKYRYLSLEKSDLSIFQALLSLETLKDRNRIEELSSKIEGLNKVIADQEIHLQNYKREVAEKESLIQSLKKEIYDKEVHIRNIETNMNLILNSKVWRLADFFRRLFYMKILKIFPPLQKAALAITREGFRSFWQKVKKGEKLKARNLYDIWMEKNSLDEGRIKSIKEEMEKFPSRPKISIIMPVYNVEKIWLEKAIQSVFNQLYENWELCVVDDGSSEKQVRETLLKYGKNEKVKIKFLEENRGISEASNQALSLASGEWVGFLDHDDELSPDALYEVVKLLNHHPEADLIYSDEDKISSQGKKIEPYFKPDWSPDLFLSYNYICHFTVCRKRILDGIKGFRKGFEGSQDYDLLLRITEKTDKIFHIPRVLYHWRQIEGSTATVHKEKISHVENSIRALEEALKRRKIEAEVEKGINFDRFESYRVRRKLEGSPLVSIIIPMRDMVSFLERNLRSIEKKTEYKNYEIIIVDNESREKETHDYFETIRKKGNVRIIEFRGEFNFSKVNNFAVTQAEGEHILFLNNDIEVISGGWLAAMLEQSMREEVGAVGAKLIFPNNTIQHAGTVLGLGGVAGHSHKHLPAESNGYFGALNVIRNYSAVTAACMMTRKKVFEEVGGFDEIHLSVAFNDVDLCLKIREKGYLIVYTPYAVLYHYESRSRGYDLNPGEIMYMKNRWGKVLFSDPYYNPNLTFDSEDFRIKIE